MSEIEEREEGLKGTEERQRGATKFLSSRIDIDDAMDLLAVINEDAISV